MKRGPIRAAEPADLGALLRLEEEAFSADRLDRRAFRHAIASPSIRALVAGPPGAIAGYALVQLRHGSRLARLTSVAVAPGAAGRGLGRTLLRAAETAARAAGCDRMRLEVRADNGPAKGLYERAGYHGFAIVPEYYEDGEAAWRYEKALGQRAQRAGERILACEPASRLSPAGLRPERIAERLHPGRQPR